MFRILSLFSASAFRFMAGEQVRKAQAAFHEPSLGAPTFLSAWGAWKGLADKNVGAPSQFMASTRFNKFGLGALKTARWLVLAASLAGLIPGSVCAFPPAPHHLVYGLVRDEMGEPISLNTAQVILESSTGVQIRGLIVPNLEPGVNYRLSVPMDAGTGPFSSRTCPPSINRR